MSRSENLSSPNSSAHGGGASEAAPYRSRSSLRIAASGLALSAALVAGSCDVASGQSAAAAPALPEVTVAEPLVETVEVYDEVVGRFAAVSSIEIRPQVSGLLTEVHFRDGQTVRAGDPLFSIDPRPFQAAADQARAELARAEAARALTRQELERARTLTERGTMPREEFDRRERAADDATAAVAASEAHLRAAEINLSYTRIAAPTDGRVSDRRIDAGNLVVTGESLLTSIVSIDPIHVEFAVPPAIAGRLPRPDAGAAAGSPVTIRLEGETEFSHEGRIDFIDNQVDPRSGVVRVRAVVENDDGRLSAGQFVRVRFSRDTIDDAVLVPDVAVSSDQNLKLVMLVNDADVVEPRPIVTGPLVDGMRVVQAGLEGGERVIVGGGQRAYPGMQVTATLGSIEVASR